MGSLTGPESFLGKDVGGYAQGPTLTGGAGVPMAGMSWGQALGGLAGTGIQAKPGQTLPFAPLVQGMKQGASLGSAQDQQDAGDIGTILQILGGVFGVGV